MSHAIALLNRKGGVGKTSTCFHLAGTLAARGYNVLCMDVDPQASLTNGFFGPAAAAGMPADRTVAAALNGWGPNLADVSTDTPVQRVAIVPGHHSAGEVNRTGPEAGEFRDRWDCLADLVDQSRVGFDYVLIDCPPNLQFNSWAALVAADSLIVPLQAEDFGAQGLDPVQTFVAQVRLAGNPDLAMLGYLITMIDTRAALPRVYAEQLRGEYGAEVFDRVVPRLTAYAEAVYHRKPVSHYKPNCQAAAAMDDLADEVIARVLGADVGFLAEQQGRRRGGGR